MMMMMVARKALRKAAEMDDNDNDNDNDQAQETVSNAVFST